jgi:hypothetical protein
MLFGVLVYRTKIQDPPFSILYYVCQKEVINETFTLAKLFLQQKSWKLKFSGIYLVI